MIRVANLLATIVERLNEYEDRIVSLEKVLASGLPERLRAIEARLPVPGERPRYVPGSHETAEQRYQPRAQSYDLCDITGYRVPRRSDENDWRDAARADCES
jgi:hypothetical protein